MALIETIKNKAENIKDGLTLKRMIGAAALGAALSAGYMGYSVHRGAELTAGDRAAASAQLDDKSPQEVATARHDAETQHTLEDAASLFTNAGIDPTAPSSRYASKKIDREATAKLAATLERAEQELPGAQASVFGSVALAAAAGGLVALKRRKESKELSVTTISSIGGPPEK